MDQLIDAGPPRGALVEEAARGARPSFRAKGEAPQEELNFADDSVRSAAPPRTCRCRRRRRFWGRAGGSTSTLEEV